LVSKSPPPKKKKSQLVSKSQNITNTSSFAQLNLRARNQTILNPKFKVATTATQASVGLRALTLAAILMILSCFIMSSSAAITRSLSYTGSSSKEKATTPVIVGSQQIMMR
jgi:hypothetical protein